MLRLGRTIKPEANEAKCGYEPFSHLAKTTKSQMEIEVQAEATNEEKEQEDEEHSQLWSALII